MKKLIFCEFNIDCTEVEYEVAHTVKQRSELDCFIYNAPLEYANLILSGDINRYLKIPLITC